MHAQCNVKGTKVISAIELRNLRSNAIKRPEEYKNSFFRNGWPAKKEIWVLRKIQVENYGCTQM